MAKSKQKSPAEEAAELVIPEIVTIHLHGKDWPIVISPRVLMVAEKATGLNLLVGLPAAVSKPSMEFVCGIVYACLKTAGTPYTFDEVVDLINLKNFDAVAMGVISACITLSRQLAEAAAEENPTNGAGKAKAAPAP